MKRVINQYALLGESLQMPRGAKILTVQVREGYILLWVLVDPKAPPEVRRFRTFATGVFFDAEEFEYIGTIELISEPTGRMTDFHLFEAVASPSQ